MSWGSVIQLYSFHRIKLSFILSCQYEAVQLCQIIVIYMCMNIYYLWSIIYSPKYLLQSMKGNYMYYCITCIPCCVVWGCHSKNSLPNFVSNISRRKMWDYGIVSIYFYGGHFSIMMPSYQHRDSHYEGKMVSQPSYLNTVRMRQNGHYFPDDIFKSIFLNENVRILINISVKFVP